MRAIVWKRTSPYSVESHDGRFTIEKIGEEIYDWVLYDDGDTIVEFVTMDGAKQKAKSIIYRELGMKYRKFATI